MIADAGGSGGPFSFPGDPGELFTLAATMSRLGQGLSQAATEIQAIDDGQWKGQAADAFRSIMHQQPAKYEQAGTAFLVAANAITAYGDALQTAQSAAATANQLWSDGQVATGNWNSAVAAKQPHAKTDPGPALEDRARSLMATATSDLATVAANVAKTLHDAESGAPHKPGFWSRLGDDLWDGFKEVVWTDTLAPVFHFGEGVVDGVEGLGVGLWDLGQMGWRSTADYWLDHKAFEAQMKQWSAMGSAIWNHPLTFAKKFGEGLLDWNDWSEDPAKAIGELVPSVALAFLSGGVSAAAKGTEATADAADALADVARAGSAAADAATPMVPVFVAESVGLTDSAGSLARTAEVMQVLVPDTTSAEARVASALSDTADQFHSAAQVIRSTNVGMQRAANALANLDRAETTAGVVLNAVNGSSPGGSTAIGAAAGKPAFQYGEAGYVKPSSYYVTTNAGDRIAIFIAP
ncbi:MAG TPA: hypothetical protein VG435_13290 [Acidimicrobiales bacterium]|jgi:hypothetical protein|nr:hypothetical protein [Acidimicrobiales bacterium]